LSNRPNPKKPSGVQKRATTAHGRTVAAQRRQASSNRTVWIVGGVAAVVLVALIVAVVVAQSGSSNKAGTADADPAAVASQVTGVTDATITAVGQGSVKNLPTAITAPALTKDGKPLVVYIGAEFCPFCAAQRWPMVQALSRFGTFSGLTLTHSTPDDSFPNTPTFTFHGATFTSADLAFEGVETQTVDRKPLDELTADQEALITKYDAPPYTPAGSKGSIPFIDFGGSYILSGALYSPQVLAGMTPDEVAAALSNPNSPVAQGIIGAANVITATICILTGDQPSNVCGNSAVAAIENQIKAQTKVS
jgi:ribosomal protein L34